MPNWVYNRVEVSGSKEGVAKFKEQAGRSHPDSWNEAENKPDYKDDDAISFWNFIAPPEEVVASGEYFGTNGWVNGEKKGDTPTNWYNYNIDKWGTKWDACEAYLEGESETELTYRFDTAWSPPEPVFEAMVKQFPDLDFEIYWEEEQGFGAELSGSGGELEITKEWDIPDSHADYVAKDDIDGCRCNGNYDDPHDWFDDCEDRETTLDEYHAENPDDKCECVVKVVAKEEPNLLY
jgi:hypothetical protein